VVYVSDQIVALCGTGRGQLGESGEYQMGRSESGPFDIQSSDGGSPCMCRLRIDRLGEQVSLCTSAYGTYGIPQT
jgi:hypothetical protein